ncbi:MAG: hypothetical protein ACPGPS_04015 [Rubripirellula sp.]
MTELITKQEQETVAKIDEVVSSLSSTIAEQAGNKITVALAQAKAATMFRNLLTQEIVEQFNVLQGSRHGFETDISYKGETYPVDVVRECLLEALLYGIRAVGGEWMIISKRCYITKAGFERLATRICKNHAVQLGDVEMPKGREGTAKVSAKMFFVTMDGNRHEIRCTQTKDFDGRIPVRVNKGMGVDGVLGKARRKGLRMIVESVSGMEISDAERTSEELDPVNFAAEAAADETARSGELFPDGQQTPYDGE